MLYLFTHSCPYALCRCISAASLVVQLEAGRVAFAGRPAEYFASPTCLHRHEGHNQVQHPHHQQQHQQQEHAGEEEEEEEEEVLASGRSHGQVEEDQRIDNQEPDTDNSGAEAHGKGTAEQARQAGEAGEAGEAEGEEQREVGHVRWHVYAAYMRSVGWWVVAGVLVSLLLMQTTRNASDVWVAVFAAHSGQGPAAAAGAGAPIGVGAPGVYGVAGQAVAHSGTTAAAAGAGPGAAVGAVGVAGTVPRAAVGVAGVASAGRVGVAPGAAVGVGGMAVPTAAFSPVPAARAGSGDARGMSTAAAGAAGEGGTHRAWTAFATWAAAGEATCGAPRGLGASPLSDSGHTTSVLLQHHQPNRHQNGSWPCSPMATAPFMGSPVTVMGFWSPWGLAPVGRAAGGGASVGAGMGMAVSAAGGAGALAGWGSSWPRSHGAGRRARGHACSQEVEMGRATVPGGLVATALGSAGDRQPAGLDSGGRAHRRLLELQLQAQEPQHHAAAATAQEAFVAPGHEWEAKSGVERQGSSLGAPHGDVGGAGAGGREQQDSGGQAGDGGSWQRRLCSRGLSLSVQWSGRTFLIGMLVISGANALFTLARAFSFAFAGGSCEGEGMGWTASTQQTQELQLGCVALHPASH